MKKFETFCQYFTLLGCIALFILTSLYFYYLDILKVAVSPSKIFGAGVLLTFTLGYTIYAIKIEGNYPRKDYEGTIDRQRKHIYFLEAVAIPRLINEIHKFQSVVNNYEQALAQYKGIISSFSTNIAKSITTPLEQSISLSNEGKYVIFKLRHNIQNILSTNNALLKLTKIQQTVINNLPKLDTAKKVSKPKAHSFQITKDYHNIFDSIQKTIMPRHSFKDVLGVLQSTYPETSPFEGEQYRFYFGDRVIKERIGHTYKGEIKLSTLEKEFSIYRNSKKLC